MDESGRLVRKRIRSIRGSKDTELSDPPKFEKETCMNPWNGECTDTNIALYIIYKGERLPICRRCWEAISSQDIEWKYD